jgi:hypothetical protein
MLERKTLTDGPRAEVRCFGYDAHQTVALEVVRRPNTTPIRLSQGFHLLTTHLPKPRLASGDISGRMVSPGAAWPWSKSSQHGSDAGWRP